MRKHLAVLGSTGSIGKQSLEIVSKHPDRFNVQLLAAHSNISDLLKQCHQFEPKYVLVEEELAFRDIQTQLDPKKTEVVQGLKAFEHCLNSSDFDLVINALPSWQGFNPSLRTLEQGIDLALANKESMVIGAPILKAAALSSGAQIRPLDSEISSVFQCLKGEEKNSIKKVWLTASGGPFLNLTPNELENVSAKSALKHPNWNMGPKISIDSATMANKAFEVYELVHFFDLSFDQIEVIIHPQSQVHALVEFIDGNIKAMVGKPDMKVHISNAMTRPFRMEELPTTSHFQPGHWDFQTFISKNHPHFELALIHLKKGGNLPAAFLACNDFWVNAFLKGQIKFTEIHKYCSHCLSQVSFIENPSTDQLHDLISEMNGLCQKEMNKFFPTPA